MKSTIAKKETVQRDWLLIDADGAVLGRLASKIAMILMGKHKPIYTPHVDTGDYVIVTNVDKIRVTGSKNYLKTYQRYSRYPSGQKIIPFAKMSAEHPERVLMLAVRRMLPKNTLAYAMLKKLKMVSGAEHEHAAQQPKKIQL